MFKKNKTTNSKSTAPANENNSSTSTLKSWITGKVGSFLMLSGVGYTLYRFGIIKKITNYFTKKDKGKAPETNTAH